MRIEVVAVESFGLRNELLGGGILGLGALTGTAGLIYYRYNVNSWETVFDGLARYYRTMWAVRRRQPFLFLHFDSQ
jgi:hypothetical protein